MEKLSKKQIKHLCKLAGRAYEVERSKRLPFNIFQKDRYESRADLTP
jgi:hypothetical protein